MPSLHYGKTFRKELKRLQGSGRFPRRELDEVLQCLVRGDRPPPRCRPHQLHGSFVGCYECHIKPDVILIYEIEGDIVLLLRLGTHEQLFG